jgi:hypothetical protein
MFLNGQENCDCSAENIQPVEKSAVVEDLLGVASLFSLIYNLFR